MLKLTAIVSLLLFGSALWASGLPCDSCGSECAAACGTRHFRSCCFNYLRRKRGPDLAKFLSHNPYASRTDSRIQSMYMMDDIPEQILTDYIPYLKPLNYQQRENLENRPQYMYDA